MSFFDRFKKKYLVTKNQIREVTEKEITATLQAMQDEGKIFDILQPSVTQSAYFGTRSVYVGKNNYPTYAKQLQTINDMYNNRTNYGGELLRAVIGTRVASICGEGINVKGEKEKTIECVEKILKDNFMLEGSGLNNLVEIEEMEGKGLIDINIEKHGKENKDEWKIKLRKYSNWLTPYEIETEKGYIDEYKSCKICLDKEKKGDPNNERQLNKDQFVYIKVGGSPDRVCDTPPRVANVLTDIENWSRAKYDMRYNNHLFGGVQPVYLCDDINKAKALNKLINETDFDKSKGYVGIATQVFYLEPSGNGQKVLHDEMVDLMRIIAFNMGIPIQLINHPELMSNRATSEDMLEMVNNSTVKERTILEEKLTEVVQKAMAIGFEAGIPWIVNDPDGFELRLSLVSYANLKQIAEIWIPLAEAEYISKKTIMSIIPGINPLREEKLLKKEKEENINNMPDMLKFD